MNVDANSCFNNARIYKMRQAVGVLSLLKKISSRKILFVKQRDWFVMVPDEFHWLIDQWF